MCSIFAQPRARSSKPEHKAVLFKTKLDLEKNNSKNLKNSSKQTSLNSQDLLKLRIEGVLFKRENECSDLKNFINQFMDCKEIREGVHQRLIEDRNYRISGVYTHGQRDKIRKERKIIANQLNRNTYGKLI